MIRTDSVIACSYMSGTFSRIDIENITVIVFFLVCIVKMYKNIDGIPFKSLMCNLLLEIPVYFKIILEHASN